MASNSLQFMRFDIQERWSIEELSSRIFESSNDEDERFVLNEITESVIDGYLITYFNSKEIVYNTETNSLDTIITKKSQVIPFSIDFDNKVIDIWSQRSFANKLVTQLGIRLMHKLRFEPIVIDLEKIALNLNDKNIRIGRIKIQDYPIENDLIASCSFDLKNYHNQLEIIKKYSKDLVQVALNIYDGQEELFTMIIYKSGSVVIYKTKEEISLETLEFIRKICIR